MWLQRLDYRLRRTRSMIVARHGPGRGSLAELSALRGRKAIRAAALVAVGLGHPVPQAAVRDAEILGDPGNRHLSKPGQLNSTLTELGRMRSRHPDFPSETTTVTSESVSVSPGYFQMRSPGKCDQPR